VRGTSTASATERFLARLGRGREEFLHAHFAAAWGWYDRLTSLCTLGRINAWRERCVAASDLGPGDRVLDVATGTGPLFLRAVRRLGSSGLAVGLDVSREGLIVARTAAGFGGGLTRWVQAEALPPPFRDGSFDAVLVGFAFRHLGPPADVLRKLRRVLVPGGRLGILDFLRPRPGPIGWAGLAYLFWVVPLVSGLLSRHRAVYHLARYLPQTILDALRPEELADEMRAAAFGLETEQSLCAGTVWLLVGRAMTARAHPTAGQRPGADTVLASERAA
jgi:demethylmenaquinone methyltransferase/2-methoxy-6-polyprenyl-1,4-benzoquinol methylase